MKRALTGIAAASMVLGAFAPSTFAATGANGWQYTVAHQLPIVVNGQVLSNPFELVANDSGNQTAYFPVYYFNQALNSIGYTATWDGSTHTWAITAPGVDATKINIPGGVGTGNTTITVNGTVVKKINTYAAKDPAGGASAGYTTYFPAFYINEVFASLGAQVSFSGQTGLSIKSTTQTTPTVSAVTFSGQKAGTGAATSPAVSYGDPLTVSATVTDASGNPASGVNAALTILGSTQPTVVQNGITLTATPITGGWSYQVPTDSNGVATATVSVPTGTTVTYTVQFSAPYTVNNQTVKDAKAYAEFVAANGVAISPYGADATHAYQAQISSTSNATAGLVPVTVTLPLLNGAPQGNVNVQFHLAKDSGTDGAFFANSQGASLGTADQNVVTDANGQATVYVDSNVAGIYHITATVTSTGASATTYISWGNPGYVAGLSSTYSASGITGGQGTVGSPYTANAGGNVTITATAVDVLGNPVAGAQILVVGSHGKYVVGTTTTSFPNATPSPGSTVTSTGAPYGEIVTTDASGKFSFTVTDSLHSNTYNVYAVSNGVVQGSSLGTFYLNFTGSTASVSQVGVATKDGLLASWNVNAAPTTSLSNVQFTSTIEDSSGHVTSPLNSIEFGAFDAANTDFLGDNASASVTYQASVSGNAFIDGVDGVKLDGSITGLPNKTSAVTVTVKPYAPASPATGHGYYEVDVNGTAIGYIDATLGTGPAVAATGTALPAGKSNDANFTPPADFGKQVSGTNNLLSAVNISVGDTTAEDTTVTVASGTGSATAKVKFTAGSVTQLAANPTLTSPVDGTATTLTLTAQDTNGNPVPFAPISLQADASLTDKGLWITAVNGVALQTTVKTGDTTTATEYTPIPLTDTTDGLGYSQVVIPGVVSWTGNGGGDYSATAVATKPSGSKPLVLYTDANGNVTLTINNKNVPFYGENGTAGDPASLTSSSDHDFTGGKTLLVVEDSTGTFELAEGTTPPAGYSVVAELDYN